MPAYAVKQFPPMPDAKPRAVILIDVAGSGKSTVVASLAKRLGCPFLDADAFHPGGNVEKSALKSPPPAKHGQFMR